MSAGKLSFSAQLSADRKNAKKELEKDPFGEHHLKWLQQWITSELIIDAGLMDYSNSFKPLTFIGTHWSIFTDVLQLDFLSPSCKALLCVPVKDLVKCDIYELIQEYITESESTDNDN